MSNKIYKSSQITLSEPKSISNSNDLFLQLEEIESEPENNEIQIEEAVEINLEEVAKQADQILKETEEMVKELMGTARQEAEKIIAEAKLQADKTIHDSIETSDKTKTDAYEQGYKEGFSKGKIHAEEETSNLKEEALKIVEDAYQEKEKIINSSEEELVKLASAIAEKIIRRELQADPNIIIDIVKGALQKVNDREKLNLMVNSEDLDSLINVQEELLTSTKGVKKMKIVADSTITPGGCVIETANGTIDARLERQLEEIEQTLMDVSNGG